MGVLMAGSSHHPGVGDNPAAMQTTPTTLDAWLRSNGWEALVNRKGTTWRKLDAAAQAGVTDAASARALMLAQPSVIKRPVVEWGSKTTVGFDPEAWQAMQ